MIGINYVTVSGEKDEMWFSSFDCMYDFMKNEGINQCEAITTIASLPAYSTVITLEGLEEFLKGEKKISFDVETF